MSAIAVSHCPPNIPIKLRGPGPRAAADAARRLRRACRRMAACERMSSGVTPLNLVCWRAGSAGGPPPGPRQLLWGELGCSRQCSYRARWYLRGCYVAESVVCQSWYTPLPL